MLRAGSKLRECISIRIDFQGGEPANPGGREFGTRESPNPETAWNVGVREPWIRFGGVA